MDFDAKCSRITKKRDRRIKGDSDLICDKRAVRDAIVSFNGLSYIVALCGEHGAHHDDAAARRRNARNGTTRRERDAATHERRVKVMRGEA